MAFSLGLKERYRRRCAKELSKFLASDEQIELPTSADPEVSLLIVLFNAAELTLRMLRSLTTGLTVPAEVVIVDNASTDRTSELCSRIVGARIVRNSQNLHFLLGINQAAAKARGCSLVLLNNDTELAVDAIRAAHETLWSANDIGAVGGRIVLLDGTLQEAGSIIWSDGSCNGFGRGEDPDDAQFQFRRDVDYCSGAFLMIRRSLFESLNGFDEAFAPAYYEETDLCMRLRAAGYKVVYEPNVHLRHFEYGSSTKDVAGALQRRNLKTFVTRHRESLCHAHHPSGTPALQARMRGQYRGRILVIDDRVPYPALGTGYPRAASMLRMIHDAGWFLTFYPMWHPDVAWPEAYRLLPRDVEILAGRGKAGLASTLRDRSDYYDVTLVSRPHNMTVFRKACSAAPKFLSHTRLIYDAEAIFAKRQALKMAVAGRPVSHSALDKAMSRELALARGATMLIAVSEEDARHFRAYTNTPVCVVGHALVPRLSRSPFEARSDILFVGALNDDDSPNTDSLIWFVNAVMPRLDGLIGAGYKIKVVGRNESKNVQALAGPRVQLLGQVEDLSDLYDGSRLFVAPTRFAAGIPMKVHEAAAHGVPIVLTPLLASQVGWTNEVDVMVAEGPADFAKACARLYSEATLWSTLRTNALRRIAEECDPQRLSSRIADALETVMEAPRSYGSTIGPTAYFRSLLARILN